MHEDQIPYLRFTTRQNIHKSIETISGIFRGISLDKKLTDGEVKFLQDWLIKNNHATLKHPYNEITKTIRDALSDGIITTEEQEDIIWLCEKFSADHGVYDDITRSIQHLHGILAGVIADTLITKEELDGLQDWLENHSHMRTCWPYDEIDALITSVLSDQKIDNYEHAMLLNFFSDFVLFDDDKTVSGQTYNGKETTVEGVCACQPEIVFARKSFCFTGSFSNNVPRSIAQKMVCERGGIVTQNVSGKTDFLVIGSEGNPCWAYACYGRKVEMAVSLRKDGSRILLVYENDFHDAVLDHS